MNTNTGAIAFSIADDFTSAASLSLMKASSNPALVPAANIVFGGSGANRAVTVTPSANQLGSAAVTVTVGDGALTAGDAFILTVFGTHMETWRFAHFGTTANAGSAADTANPDGDPWTNAKEYIFGTSPTAANGILLDVARSGGNAVLTFNAVAAAGPGYAGLTRRYTLESAPAFAAPATDWQPVSGYEAVAGAGQVVTAIRPLDALRRYYRLKAWLE